MKKRTAPLGVLLDQVVKECLREGFTVEFDGVGRFEPDGHGGVRFIANRKTRVFIAYASEDELAAMRLYVDLQAAGMDPWLDQMKLMPGQNWRKCIEHAISTSDFFVACFSKHSTNKRGFFPYELRCGLKAAERMLFDDIFVIPARLEKCQVPRSLGGDLQYVDLYPDWAGGSAELVRSIQNEMATRQGRAPRP
jgi:hypothetical protein